MYGDFYCKDGGLFVIYMYMVMGQLVDVNVFFVQVNGQGQLGYWFVGLMMVGVVQVNVYMKNNVLNVIYMYDVLMLILIVDDFIVQVNSEGVKGYCVKGVMVFGIVMLWVYVKDQMQLLIFLYQLVMIQLIGVSFVQQVNMFGVQGIVYLGDIVFGSFVLVMVLFYFMLKNCMGFLCMMLNLFMQN